jgi:DNA/RNA endonuclease YhcR with UshA esterase domain
MTKKGGDQLAVAGRVKEFRNSQGVLRTIPELANNHVLLKRIKFVYLQSEGDQQKGSVISMIGRKFSRKKGKGNIVEHEISGQISIHYGMEMGVANLIFDKEDEFNRIPDGTFHVATLDKTAVRSENFFQFTLPAMNVKELEW